MAAGAGLAGIGAAVGVHLGAGKAQAGWGLDSFPAPLSKQLLPPSPAFLCPYHPAQGKAINVIGHEVIHPLRSYRYANQALLLETGAFLPRVSVPGYFV